MVDDDQLVRFLSKDFEDITNDISSLDIGVLSTSKEHTSAKYENEYLRNRACNLQPATKWTKKYPYHRVFFQ
ncbi:hypothetical protein RIF29_14546 [Crotalaria pallida]|uniref:Uncharacterized protein n=1 Tax=Crotalaria pallida TaxID=3830 RepID=A0AAN9FH92_CROPI